MFGFLYAIVLVIAGIKDSVNNDCYKAESKHRAIKNGSDIYYDMHGNEYYKDRKVLEFSAYGMPNGEAHRVIIDLKTKVILKDYTQELIDKFFKSRDLIIEKAKINGDLFYEIKPPALLIRNKSVYDKRIKGYCGRFETETGRRYGLSSSFSKQHKKIVYYKYYYKKNDLSERDELYFIKDKLFVISKEEYFKWGGSTVGQTHVYIPKGGII